MTISFPRTDILTTFGFRQQSFDLFSRQELSRTAGGVTVGKDLGPAIWMVEYTTTILEFDDAVTFEAMLRSLDGMINSFEAHDLRRPYPKAHADGNFNDTGTLHTVDADNKRIRVGALPAGFVLSVGDYLAFTYGSNPSSRALHQVVETATVDGAGLTPLFEVRPHVRPGHGAGGSPSSAVTLKKPSGLFTLEPSGMKSQMEGVLHSVVTLRAVQYI